jgi:hypothetical protein
MNFNDANAHKFADHFLGSRISSQHIDGNMKVGTPLIPHALVYPKESSEIANSHNNTAIGNK